MNCNTPTVTTTKRHLLTEDRNYELWSPLHTDTGIDTGIEIARRSGDVILGFCIESMARRERGDGSLVIATVLEDNSVMPFYRYSESGWIEF